MFLTITINDPKPGLSGHAVNKSVMHLYTSRVCACHQHMKMKHVVVQQGGPINRLHIIDINDCAKIKITTTNAGKISSQIASHQIISSHLKSLHDVTSCR